MDFLMQNDPRFPRRDSVLKDKKILFCGDSICAASVYDYKDCNRWGWAGRISSATGCFYINAGVDGASLSTCRKENRILTQLEAHKNEEFDLIVLHGGVNDAWDSIPAGKRSKGLELADFDTSTCAGGLEELFFHVKKYFPETKVCFIANFRAPSCPTGRISDMTEYFEEILAICRKWSVPCLDLYHDEDFSKEFRVAEKVHTADFIHPVGSGYNLLYTPIKEFLERLF